MILFHEGCVGVCVCVCVCERDKELEIGFTLLQILLYREYSDILPVAFVLDVVICLTNDSPGTTQGVCVRVPGQQACSVLLSMFVLPMLKSFTLKPGTQESQRSLLTAQAPLSPQLS